MANYPKLNGLASRLTNSPSGNSFAAELIPYLISVWLDDYDRWVPKNDIVEIKAHRFSYLFDLEHHRLIAAWGISEGRSAEPRLELKTSGYWSRAALPTGQRRGISGWTLYQDPHRQSHPVD